MNIEGTAPTAAAMSAALEAKALPEDTTPVLKKAKADDKPAAPRRGRQAETTGSGLSGKRAIITLHDSERIPPGGQFIGLNGVGYLLLPGVEANVPVELMNVLNDAVMTEPVLNDRLQIDGFRQVPRLTFTFHRYAE